MTVQFFRWTTETGGLVVLSYSLEKSKRAFNDVSLTEKKVYKAYAVYKPKRAVDRAPAGYL
jgi:hypothetical protein